MFNLPVGVGKELDDDLVLCEVCENKEDVDDGEYVDGEFVCNGCLKEHFVKTEDGYLKVEKYDDWKTDKMRDLIEEIRNVNLEYYRVGNVDILRNADEPLEELEKFNEQIRRFVDDATFFYIERNKTTLNQLYHIIDYMFGTELEIK